MHPTNLILKISKKLEPSFFILFLILFPKMTEAQIIQPRLNQGALLEPQGRIINGAGQDLASYKNYWNVMHEQDKPLMYMTYFALKDVGSDWADGLKSDLLSNPGIFQIPQIGLSMASDGTSNSHYEQDVAAGLYDKQISMFIDGLQTLAIPAYLRIGYEFNGTSWNGYVADTYKKAFQHITDLIRARGVEVATVWNFSLDAGVANMNFMDYYPGDAYVDWWAINLYSVNHFNDPYGLNFLDSAQLHHKPVMIGETAPRGVGVLNAQQSWNDWFNPFFKYIHSNPGIKAFSYIDWQWANYPQWSTWGDSRLEQNAFVANAFANEMDSLEYLHASSEKAFRQTLGFSDNTPPSSPGNVSLTQMGFPLLLDWNPVTDPSGLSHYLIYKHGKLNDYCLKLPYADKNVTAGDTATYAVSAMDRAGNESIISPGLNVTIPANLSKALNGDFEKGIQDWHLSIFNSGALANMSVDSSYSISGKKSCKIMNNAVTGTDWHIELWQWLSIHPGHKYRISFKARASASKVISVAIQQNASPYTMYMGKSHTLTTDVQTFTDSVTINLADQAKLEFFLGKTLPTVWIDDVVVTEIASIATGLPTFQTTSSGLLHIYPNPFQYKANILYMVPENGRVSIKIFDVTGKEIDCLVNEVKPAGNYSAEWTPAHYAKGLYFCKFQAGKYIQVDKLCYCK